MKLFIEIEIEPFAVPDHVLSKAEPGLKQDGMRAAQRYPLSALDEVTLNRLCDEFRAAVFHKAGKPLVSGDAPPGWDGVK